MRDLELYKEILGRFNDELDGENMECIDKVEVNGITYSYEEEDVEDTIDEGKYQYGGTIYAIGVSKEDGFGIVEPLFYVKQDFTKSGSYFSHQEYEYEELYIVEKKEEVKIITSWKSVC